MKLALGLVGLGLLTSEVALSQSLLGKERAQRRDQVISAEEQILSGDTFYRASEFEKAVEAYRAAYSLLPEGEKTAGLRAGARQRYAQAAVEAAKVMNREGRREDALRLMEEVLSPDVDPDYAPAQIMQGKLFDPIRSNPAATPEHVANVDEVRRLLYTAEGAYNLGDFDKALALYESVLRIDQYNKAARRGMERCNAQISEYAGVAYDHMRADLLNQVEAGWQLPEKKVLAEELLFQDVGAIGGGVQARALNRKLDEIIVPFVEFEESSLREAVEYLEAQARNLDPISEESEKGVSFVIDVGSGNTPEAREVLNRRFSFRLRNVPLRQVLEYVTRQTKTRYRVDDFAVVISPLAGATDTLVVRRYKVPPAFMTQSSAATAADNDPFGSDDEGQSRLAPRLSAREILENSGVGFPEGATASFNAALGELFVKNTSVNHQAVEDVLAALREQEPIQVVIETKLVRVEQENIEELGFDTAFDKLVNDGNMFLGGGTTSNGRASDFITGLNPVSAGLRSGDFAVSGDPLNNLLNREQRQVTAAVTTLSGTNTFTPDDVSDSVASAPGFLSALGVIDDYGVSVLLRGLQNKKGVDLMTQPSVVTRNGEQAVIESVKELIYPTEYDPPEMPDSIGTSTLTDLDTGQSVSPTSFIPTPSHPTAFETANVGTILEVQPIVSQDRSVVDLTITPTIKEFLGFINYGEPLRGGSTQASFGLSGIDVTGQAGEVTSNDILMPLFDTVRARTQVTIANGHTVLIGGVVTEQVEKVEDKVPLLGDLPLIGRGFRSEVNLRQKKLVMIFVTVRVVDPGGNDYQPR
ncbi:MAG: hypothetical protein Q7Q71_03000 [Verrucomicrobiota bacterium JB023]|nr:hypothetical protein [Verrucomicrobiota bacterium JB023]